MNLGGNYHYMPVKGKRAKYYKQKVVVLWFKANMASQTTLSWHDDW